MPTTLPPIDALGLVCLAVADLDAKQNIYEVDVMWTAAVSPDSEYEQLRSPFWQGFGTATVLTSGLATV